jgi:sialic acid synthase SpsE/mannose-6-phosphate isomerase-like protein (cupin superfamily)
VKTDFEFADLFIFDLANNHQGDVGHGVRIARELGEIARANSVRAALKLQFRDLPDFIHPAHREGSDNPHVGRFLSTALGADDFRKIVDETREQGLVTMCTPFDEASVQQIVSMEIEVVKVASCSAVDWPLLETIAESNKPVVVSTGGLTLKDIDDIVSFFDHRRVHFALEHCVSIYPTPRGMLELNQIEILRRRYRSKVIGFSTHEDPDDLMPVCVAVSKGARILERHVGIETDEHKLNAYSSTPEQIDRWLRAGLDARQICGAEERQPAPPEETAALESLKRGVYARRRLKKGEPIARGDVYFALPRTDGQLASGQWRDELASLQGIEKDQPLTPEVVRLPNDPDKQVLFTSIHTIKAMLNEAKIALGSEFEVEFSHHYGLARFPEVGATMITCINRDYCKKLVIQMPGQRHPLHYHKRKEETFQVLHGTVEMEVEGRHRVLYPGDTQLVQQGVWHEFWSASGAILEEVSTRHFQNDSFYEDKEINRMERDQRKTLVNNWGRYQI